MPLQMEMTFISSKKIEREEFERILEDHKKWLEDNNTGKRADLSNLDLSNMDLSGINLSYAYMQGVNLMGTKLIGADFSYADLHQAFMHKADFSEAIIEGACFTNADLITAKLNNCKGRNARFHYSCMWECELKNAVLTKADFLGAEVCDCDFTESDLEEAMFACADLDNAVFKNTNLKNADFNFAYRTFWSDFQNSDMTGTRVKDVDLDPCRLEGVKGLYIPLYCPEEGSFTAWKKCREGKVVKLLIPEHADRKGNSLSSCRASEAVVLEIYDKNGNTAEDAISIIDEDFKYVKGTAVFPKEMDPKCYGDITGIYFVLSRAETEFYKEKEEHDDEYDAEKEE